MIPQEASVRTKREVSTTISKAVNENRPISVKIYYLTDASQESLRGIIGSILEKYDRMDLMDICYNSVRGLVVNATKANIKRALFKDIGLEITNPRDYAIGMEKINKYLNETNFNKYKEKFKKHNLTVKTTFDFNPEVLNVLVKNDFPILPIEEQKIREKLHAAKSIPMLVNYFESFEKEEPTIFKSDKVVSLEQYKIDKQIFSLLTNQESNETIIKLEIPLNDKNIFSNEVFKIRMDSLFSDYKSKFDQVFHKSMDELNNKTSKIMEEFQNRSEESRKATDDILDKIQKLGSNLYEEQQALIANYGDNVFKNFQDKIIKAKLDSDETVTKIKEASEQAFEQNKKQIDAFSDSLDDKIAEQTNAFLEKHKQKIDEFNKALDRRIANQSSILQGQTNLYLDQMKKSNLDFVETTRKEFGKTRSEFLKVKSDVESELKRAIIMKQNLFNELNVEKDSLRNSLNAMSEKIRKVEKFQMNMERMEELVTQSEKAFLNMSSKFEQIKCKEEDVNSFLRNTDLIEAAKRSSEIEISMLEAQKNRINQLQKELEKTNQACLIINKKAETLTEKVSLVDVIEAKFKQLEKFGDDINQKLVEISSFGKKLNVLSSSLVDQTKKSQNIENSMTRITKDMEVLDKKGNELNGFLSQVDQKIALINSKNADMKLMESKFSKIEIMMTDLSIRHKQIVTMENRLDEIKTEMESLLYQAEDKISKFGSLMESSDASKNKKKNNQKFSTIMKNLKNKVITLHSKNVPVVDIAYALEVDEEIVEAILSKAGM